ncbi:MAG: hypothetical protein GF355_13320, partial [Candidatus Eisenbacteria bacterium]|nr:hypothetical protein [Candidatus Eisenbacteria bacterium]
VLALFTFSVVERLSGSAETWRAAPDVMEPPDSPITIVVLNGCGRTGLASRIRDLLLEETGFDVVDVDDAGDYAYPETLVADLRGQPDRARRVVDFLQLNLGVGRLVHHEMNAPPAQVLVVLGHDVPETIGTRL